MTFFTHMPFLLSLVAMVLIGGLPVHAESTSLETFTVTQQAIADEKSVFATVESANVVPARVRTGGTILDLKVRQGDRVEKDQIIATVGDQKLGLQIQSQAAQAKGVEAQVEQARRDLGRGIQLLKDGYVTKSRFDQLQAAYDVALNNLKSLKAQQSVTEQQQTEGNVLAPTAGRILTVPVTAGTVVLSGDTVATLAEQNYILRLNVPERHANFIKAGDTLRVDRSEMGGSGSAPSDYGKVKLVYPKVENGRVLADAEVKGLGDYFVGARVRVWIQAGSREAIIIPIRYITTRNGIDYAHLKTGQTTVDIPVQRGGPAPREGMPDGLEILSGLKAGDVLVMP